MMNQSHTSKNTKALNFPNISNKNIKIKAINASGILQQFLGCLRLDFFI